MRLLSVLSLGAQLAAAISFSDPAENATLTRGTTFDLGWSFVDTDPTTFSVYLVNFVNWPPFYTPLELSLETSTGEASVRIPCAVDDSYGYQFNAINGTNVYVIYAQTPKFSIAGDSCTDPVPTATVPTCAAPTVTVTVRGNSSFTSRSTTGSATPLPSSATSTFQGACPSTIGWGGNYSQPVTLSSLPNNAGRTVVTPTGTTTTPEASGTGFPAYGTGQHNWNTTITAPTITGARTTTGTPTATGLTGAETGKSKSCSKKRQARKRHSDGNGQTKPRPRR